MDFQTGFLRSNEIGHRGKLAAIASSVHFGLILVVWGCCFSSVGRYRGFNMEVRRSS